MNRESFRRFESDVEIERMRQVNKWGEQHYHDGTSRAGDDMAANRARSSCDARAALGLCTWRDILNKEIAEAFAERDPIKLRTELVQCAAVIAAWLEDIDSRETK
uniref:Uncharacterized protein n=1 Tax=uncultured organism TaxID=155900 RepID=A0A7L9QC04_9ZZZZ|nr:hypothetical protein [uncultured organism]